MENTKTTKLNGKSGGTIRMVLGALFLALAFVLPFLTAQNYQLGNMLCPMHIPALLCGFVCGWPYGLAVGFIAPLLRFLTLGAPPMPTALTMAFELAAYGFFAGLLYAKLPKKLWSIYASLIGAMLAGRVVLGVVQTVVYGFSGKEFAFMAFIQGAFVTALPGIVLQIVLIPAIVFALKKAKVME